MKQFLTYGQLDYTCMKQAGNLNDQDIYLATRQSYINTKLMKIYGILDGINDPFYNRVTTITVSADQEQLKDLSVNGGTITSINATAKTISRSSGVFIAGSIINVATGNATNGLFGSQWCGRIVVGGATATYSIISGTDITASGAGIFISVLVTKSLSSTAIDVSSIYYQRFIRLSDPNYTATPSQKIRVFDRIQDPQVFFNMDKDPMATKRIFWYQSGDTINITVGSSANALGVVTGEYRGKPAIFDDTTIDNTIDLPPEFTQMLIDEVIASYLIDRSKPIPNDIIGRMENYQKAYESAAASRAKAMEIANK